MSAVPNGLFDQPPVEARVEVRTSILDEAAVIEMVRRPGAEGWLCTTEQNFVLPEQHARLPARMAPLSAELLLPDGTSLSIRLAEGGWHLARARQVSAPQGEPVLCFHESVLSTRSITAVKARTLRHLVCWRRDDEAPGHEPGRPWRPWIALFRGWGEEGDKWETTGDKP